MEALRAKGYDTPLIEYIQSGKPYMGICIGMQVTIHISEYSLIFLLLTSSRVIFLLLFSTIKLGSFLILRRKPERSWTGHRPLTCSEVFLDKQSGASHGLEQFFETHIFFGRVWSRTF
jgi:hypothetical protein